MAERGAFAPLGPRPVSKILYVGLGNPPEIRATEITPQIAEKVWAELTLLIASYMRRDQGYTSRRATQKQLFEGDYDHLARFGEWEANITPTPEDVG